MDTRFNPNASYANRRYVEDRFEAKSDEAPDDIFDDIMALWDLLNDNPSASIVALALFALGYFIFPFDAVPDFIPVAGYLDDGAVIASVVSQIGPALHPYR